LAEDKRKKDMNQETKVIVNRGGRNAGPFTYEQLRECLGAGTIQENDFAWLDNGNQWMSVTEALMALKPPAPRTVQEVLPAGARYPNQLLRPATTKLQKIIKARILINRGGASFGPYTPDQVRDCLSDGTILENDFAWLDGGNRWMSVTEALELCKPPEGPKYTPPPVVENPNLTGRRVTTGLQIASKRSSMVRRPF
jgi:hypothetical protein